MKSDFLLLVAVAITFFFGSRLAKAAPEDNFWKWFSSNESTLYDFDKNQEAIFNSLSIELHKVNPNLTFEFSPKIDGHREFVISADGIRDAFPAVEALYAKAPVLPRWKFIKFRQRHDPSDITYGGITIEARKVRVLIVREDQRAKLTIYVQGYSQAQHKAYAPIVFLLLDQALGEYDVETNVGQIQIKSVTDAPTNTCTLAELPKNFDALLNRK